MQRLWINKLLDIGRNAAEVASGKVEPNAAVRIRELISRLPAKPRQALHLRHFAGLEFEEIATAMKCSQESARANVSQAMRRIRVEW